MRASLSPASKRRDLDPAAAIATSLRADPRAGPAARPPRRDACGRARGSRTSRSASRAAPDRRPERRAPAPAHLPRRPLDHARSSGQRVGQGGMLGRDPVEPARRLAELGQAAVGALHAGRRWSRARREPCAAACRAKRRQRSSSPAGGANLSSSSTACAANRGRSWPPRAPRTRRQLRLGVCTRARAAAAGAPSIRPKPSRQPRWPRGLRRPRRRAGRESRQGWRRAARRPAATGWSSTKARLPPSGLDRAADDQGSPASCASPFSSSKARAAWPRPISRRR